MQVNKLIVCEPEMQLPVEDFDILNWSSYFSIEKDNIFSLPQLVDKEKKHLRSKYLELIYDWGEIRIDGKRLVDCLEIRPNFSYWWMTLLSEKCNALKSPQINNAIKLLAFKDWLSDRNYKEILFISSNATLAEAVSLLSDNLGIDFKWKKVKNSSNNEKFLKFLYHKLPYILQALLWFAYRLITRWQLKGVGVWEWKNSNASMTFVSYLFNLSSKSIEKGNFESRHWAVLPDLLHKHEIASNWLHLYNKDRMLPSASSARNLIKKFNISNKSGQVHTTLDSFLSYKAIVGVLSDWYELLKINHKISKHIAKHASYLWPLIRKDYKTSISGAVAIENLLNLKLFESAMLELPKQKNGFYPQENQGWEFGFIYAWKSINHSKNLVGIPHSTIRYWDLRYYFDKRNYNGEVSCGLPLPDYVGVNGSKAKEMYILGGYPEVNLVEVEALRYIYINNIADINEINNNYVLVLGGKNIKQQMRLLASSADLLNESLRFIVKADAWNPIELNDFQKLNIEMTTDSMSELLVRCNAVYADNITSASVDAYCLGKQVVSMLDPSMLNLSPLIDTEGVIFVSSPKELAEALNGNSMPEHTKKEYFYLDPNLKKWEELITGGNETEN